MQKQPEFLDLDLDKFNRIHIIGIGGAGMSAIAMVLKGKGKKVSGSDLKESQVTSRLETSAIKVSVPHNKALIDENIDLVVRSTAIPDNNEEVQAALASSIPLASRADVLSAICAEEKAVGIAGSHGKTTTTSMVTAIARAANLDPSFMVGGDLNEIGTNASYKPGSILIVEADESDRTFLRLSLKGAVVTNIENDHLENYDDSFDQLVDGFRQFIKAVDGPVVLCTDEVNTKQLSEEFKENENVISVAKQDADWIYQILSVERGGISADVYFHGEKKGTIELAVPGEHNIKNALCALVLMNSMGVEIADCIRGLKTFGGVARRFQFRGETKGITFVDDYAHLPTEIKATLGAAKDGSFRNVIAIFQPHRYSRTQLLAKEFAEALMSCDSVGVCDVYSAGEDPRPGVSGMNIVSHLRELGHKDCEFIPHIQDASKFVFLHAQPGDIVLTLGAGDITMYSDIIQTDLESMEKV